jgi:hypothetical protein
MTGPDPIFVSLLRVTPSDMARRHRNHAQETPTGIDDVRILRSVLMKPESEAWVAPLLSRIEELAQG